MIRIRNLNEFDEIKQKNLDKIILIFFESNWCAKCTSFANIFKKLQLEYSDDFFFTSVNVSETQALAKSFNVLWIPTIIFLKNNDLLKKVPGVANYDTIKILLNKLKNS